MLRKINDLRGFELYATDGDIGRVAEFYFDDLDWTVLYMVVDSGAWLPGRRVLISPAVLGETDWIERKMNLMITREEIEKSPEIDLHQPITREQEVSYFAHFGWACLWSGELRSTEEIIGNQVITTDGGINVRVEDLIVDDLLTICGRFVI
ncbi:MAG: PRC-barrel domain-containing protein [Pyrinomonadaceae bacterium]